MKNNKGFATSFILFSLLALFLIVVLGVMFTMNNTSSLNNRIKNKLLSGIELSKKTKSENVVNPTEATFKIGMEVNDIMKSLANNTEISGGDYQDYSITSIKYSNLVPSNLTDDNIVSTEESDLPIYMWYDDSIIYWYSEAGTIYLNEDSTYMFSSLYAIESFPDFKMFNTEKVEYADDMFSYFAYNSDTIELDLSGLNMENATSTQNMFSYFGNDAKNISLNLRNFNIKESTNIDSIFSHLGEYAETIDVDLSNFNAESAGYTSLAFEYFGTNSKSIYLSLKNANLKNVSDDQTFSNFGAYTTDMINLDFSNLDLRSSTLNFSSIGSNCMETNLNLSNARFYLESYMFYNFGGTGEVTIDLSNFKNESSRFEQVFIDMNPSVFNLNLSNFNPNGTTNMYNAFHSFGHGTNTINLNLSNISNISDTSHMFDDFGNSGATINIDFTNFDTSNVIDMSYMFYYCNIASLDLGFDTSNVTDMSYMFSYSNIDSLNLNFDTSNVTNMSYMFSNYYGSELYLSSFDTSSVTDMSYMFENFGSYAIYVSDSFVIDQVQNSDSMFENAYSLCGEQGTCYDYEHIDKEYARIDEAYDDNPGYFSRGY